MNLSTHTRVRSWLFTPATRPDRLDRAAASGADVSIIDGDYRIALPETEDFVKADLRRDPGADLAKAEGAKK